MKNYLSKKIIQNINKYIDKDIYIFRENSSKFDITNSAKTRTEIIIQLIYIIFYLSSVSYEGKEYFETRCYEHLRRGICDCPIGVIDNFNKLRYNIRKKQGHKKIIGKFMKINSFFLKVKGQEIKNFISKIYYILIGKTIKFKRLINKEIVLQNITMYKNEVIDHTEVELESYKDSVRLSKTSSLKDFVIACFKIKKQKFSDEEYKYSNFKVKNNTIHIQMVFVK